MERLPGVKETLEGPPGRYHQQIFQAPRFAGVGALQAFTGPAAAGAANRAGTPVDRRLADRASRVRGNRNDDLIAAAVAPDLQQRFGVQPTTFVSNRGMVRIPPNVNAVLIDRNMHMVAGSLGAALAADGCGCLEGLQRRQCRDVAEMLPEARRTPSPDWAVAPGPATHRPKTRMNRHDFRGRGGPKRSERTISEIRQVSQGKPK